MGAFFGDFFRNLIDMNVRELTKQMIALPSYDDGSAYEKPMSDFLVAYAREQFPWLDVTLQEVAPNRFNVLLRDSAPTRLLVIDQIDTVVPDAGWRTNPLEGVETDGKIYGLGASDSKGNVAAFFTALKSVGETRGLAVLLYVDEEYFFQGMKAFVASGLPASMDPACILSIDGNGSSLGTGCRGLVEFDVRIRSESGHSANPKTPGALKPFLSAFQNFQAWVASRATTDQGASTAQVAFLRGGMLLEETEQGPVFGKEGNRIPNFAEAKVEVRTTAGLGWKEIEAFWRAELGANAGIEFVLTPVFDYAGFSTPRAALEPVVRAVEEALGAVSYLDAATFGYLDIAMLKQAYPNAALCSFGIGEPGVTHRANEYVVTDRLEGGVSVYKQILSNVLA